MFGGKTLNLESETNLLCGCVTPKLNEFSAVNVKRVNFAFYDYLMSFIAKSIK